jgi:hypothetical protein
VETTRNVLDGSWHSTWIMNAAEPSLSFYRYPYAYGYQLPATSQT